MSSNNKTVGTTYTHEMWSSRFAFILAATGSAVGLGNIWKFPYITGENGGGAFVLVYLLCIAAVGLPIMMAEVMLGRSGRQSPINSLRRWAQRENAPGFWVSIGWVGVSAAFIILSFYSVIGGWAVSYVGHAASGAFSGADAESVGQIFSALLASPGKLLLWHSVFMGLVIFVVARGVSRGLERTVQILMPSLFVLLLILVGYAMTSGEFGTGISFLFSPDFSKLTMEGVLTALGHAFFTLSLGMGAMIAYGSYLPDHVSIAKTSLIVSVMDTLVALLAGLAIFPIVFANDLAAGAGPGLIFQTLPLAFGQMPGGTLFGTLFFIMLVFAAWTSAISLLEPLVEWLEEHKGVQRVKSALIGGVLAWLLGIASLLSLNEWSGVHPLGMFERFAGMTIFDLLDFLTANIMLPLAGLLAALFVGWVVRKESAQQALELEGPLFALWRFVLRYLTPAGVLIVFIYNL